MPRLSAEARATLTASREGKLEPSRHLSPEEKRAWRILVDATPAGHFSERDRPLVESFVVLSCAQRKLASMVATASAGELLADGAPGIALKRLEALAKTLATLSNRLKIAPLAAHSAPHRAGQRDEHTAQPGRLLGGLKAIK